MQTQLLPAEVLDNTSESYLPQVAVKSQLIYTLILLALMATFIALPYIFVDVSVQSRGLIRTVSDKTELRAIVSGRIKNIKIAENQSINSNEALVQLGTEELDAKLSLNSFQQKTKQQFISDLQSVLSIERSNLFGEHPTQSPYYTQQLNTFRAQIQENIFFQKKTKKELDADRYLYKEKVIAMREIDAKEYDYTRLQAEYETIFNRQRSQWQADLNQNRMELGQLQSEAAQIAQQKTLYTIKAPVSGTLQQLTGKYVGSFLQSGETLGSISPDSSLLVEVYVSPRDIGFIKKGMPVNIQMDAFNYNEWGLAKATVQDVGNDFVLMDNQPIFKVKCELHTKFLKLKNGYTAHLKKGMTLRARFVITKRNLYQLLYDNMDDWLNPKTL